MADHGAIGKGLPLVQVQANVWTPQAMAARRLGAAGTSGRPGINAATISGTVKELGSPVAGRTVAVLRRRDHVCLGTAVTASDGSFSILCATSEEVYVVAFDPVSYQAIVYDRVYPL